MATPTIRENRTCGFLNCPLHRPRENTSRSTVSVNAEPGLQGKPDITLLNGRYNMPSNSGDMSAGTFNTGYTDTQDRPNGAVEIPAGSYFANVSEESDEPAETDLLREGYCTVTVGTDGKVSIEGVMIGTQYFKRYFTYEGTPEVTDKSEGGDTGITMAYTYKQARSPKRGLSFNNLSKPDLELLSPGVCWIYNWGSSTSIASMLGDYDMTYYPMVWGGNPNESTIASTQERVPGCDMILAYNEPNLTDQANMTPTRASELWPNLVAVAEKLGMRLTSPAMNYGTLAGYSWFKERGGNTWSAISLLNINASNPELTDLGKVYVNFSTFDKTVYYAIGEAIPAEHYCNNSLAASANTDTWETAPHVKPTTDVTGILELCDFYAVGNWVEYQIDVANSGDYEMLLRYANPIDGQFTLDIDGAETPISLPKTGDETTWRTASAPETAIRRERLNRLFSRSRLVHMQSFLSEILLRTHQLNTCVPPQIARITLVIGIVPMLGHTEAPDRRTVAFGVIDRARRRIAGLCCLRKVHVGVIYIGHVGKFVGQEIDTDHVDGHRVLAGKE